MRTDIPAEMAADLASGGTFHCRLWKLTYNTGRVLGFTDHDQTLTIANIPYRPATGFQASSMEQSLGLGVDNSEVLGILSSDSITENDIAGGFLEGAIITYSICKWTSNAKETNTVILFEGIIGEVSRGNTGIKAELRSYADMLNRASGRQYGHLCDADVFDSRCGVDHLGTSPLGYNYSSIGAVTSATDRLTFRVTTPENFPSGWFNRGRVKFFFEPLHLHKAEIRNHVAISTTVHEITLWMSVPYDFDTTKNYAWLFAGCDKTAETCALKFDNIINNRGFPRMPGNDVIMRVANQKDNNDGGSVWI